MDVDAAAAANAAVWRARADDACAGDEGRERFRSTCNGTLAGTNVDAGKLAHFRELDPPRIVSTAAFVRAVGGPQSEPKMYAGEWGPRRRAFEEGIDALGTVVYGTLDLPGCPGDDKYGAYRLCYDPSESAPCVLPYNSALVYGDGGRFREQQFQEDVARWGERANVAASVHGDEAQVLTMDAWPRLLAEPRPDHDLVEVVIRGEPPALSGLHQIRVSETYLTAALQGSYAALGAVKASDIEQAVRLAGELAAEAETGPLDLVKVPESA